MDSDQKQEAAKRFLARIRNATNLGTNGEITWTRDELHDRALDRAIAVDRCPAADNDLKSDH